MFLWHFVRSIVDNGKIIVEEKVLSNDNYVFINIIVKCFDKVSEDWCINISIFQYLIPAL